MAERRLEPTIRTFKMLISKAPSYGEARRLLDEMAERRLEPTIETFRRLIRKTPSYDEARRLHTDIAERGLKLDWHIFYDSE